MKAISLQKSEETISQVPQDASCFRGIHSCTLSSLPLGLEMGAIYALLSHAWSYSTDAQAAKNRELLRDH